MSISDDVASQSSFVMDGRATSPQSASPTPSAAAESTIFSFFSIKPQYRDLPGREQHQLLRAALMKRGGFEHGFLLDTFEKGVVYPIIHIVDSPLSLLSRSRYMEPSTIKTPDNNVENIGDEFTLVQGVYKEVKHVVPNGRSLSPRTSDQLPGCILIGFKSLDHSFDEMLEKTWKEWTGARFLYLNIHDDFQLSRITFYHRISPRNPDLFMYIVVAECDHVGGSNRMRLLDFVQRMRLERMSGYLSAYRAVPFSWRNRYFSEEENTTDTASAASSTCLKALMEEVNGSPVKVETW